MVLKRFKKFMKKKAREHQRGLEAERIYKRERELAYAQAKRGEALKLAHKGKKPKKEGGLLTTLFGPVEGKSKKGEGLFGSDPLGLFATPKKKRKKATRKKTRKKRGKKR